MSQHQSVVSTDLNTDRRRSQHSARFPELPTYSWRNISPQTQLLYIRDCHTADLALSEPLEGPLGFDLEWKPNFVPGRAENPVALVQLATTDKIFLFQVTAMTQFPVKLCQLLENPLVVKAGVSIQNDCRKLWNNYRVNVSNCVDLGLLARTVDNPRWKGSYQHPIGLANLCGTYCGMELPKGKVQRSNWELVLSPIQQEYAANDCHSGLQIYKILSSMLANTTPSPHCSYYTFDMMNGLCFQPSPTLKPASQRMMWGPFNPHYDPGPQVPRAPVDPSKRRSRPATNQGNENGTTPPITTPAGSSPSANDAQTQRAPSHRGKGRSQFPSRGRTHNRTQPT